jgi:hypothetical protein
LAKIEGNLARLGERVIGLMQQYLTGDQVARIVTMPGKAWVNYDPEYIQGEFDYEVAAGSTEPQNETFRRQSALQLVDATMPFLQSGVANPQALLMQVLQKGFGIKDVGNFINQPQAPQVDPATGQPQGVLPGGPQPAAPGPPSGPPTGPQGMPPGVAPAGLAPGNGNTDIPPELLQAMMAGGAPGGA